MTVQDIPALNASLNGVATVLLTVGFIFIKRGQIAAHRAVMISACGVSAVFLIGYVTHKALIGAVHTPFGGTGIIRGVYYAMLVSHIILAMSIAYLVPRTFLFAIHRDFEKHQAWARWTFPIWYYVSITGVLVYFFLYRWWPAAAGTIK
jgi:putative membrane protein